MIRLRGLPTPPRRRAGGLSGLVAIVFLVSPGIQAKPPPREAKATGVVVVETAEAEPTEGFRFVSPVRGKGVHPGDIVEYSLAYDADAIPRRVVVEADFFAGMEPVTLTRPPFEGRWRVPEDVFGRVELFALGEFEPTAFYAKRRAVVYVHVLPAAPPVAMLANGGWSYSVREGGVKPLQLEVIGDYGQGRQWPLADSATGTAFESLDPWIASVSPTGRVTGHDPGRTLVAVRNGHLTEYVHMTVLDANGEPPAPDDITENVAILITVERENPERGYRTARVSVRNESARPLWMPLWLLLDGTTEPAFGRSADPRPVCRRLHYPFDAPGKAPLLPGGELQVGELTYAWPPPDGATITPRVLAATGMQPPCW